VPAQLVAVVPIGSETCETRYKYGMETCNGYDIHLLHIVVRVGRKEGTRHKPFSRKILGSYQFQCGNAAFFLQIHRYL
jgi:hypothetical protein